MNVIYTVKDMLMESVRTWISWVLQQYEQYIEVMWIVSCSDILKQIVQKDFPSFTCEIPTSWLWIHLQAFA